MPIIDLIVIVFYLAGLACLGALFSKKNKNTEQYFLGGRSIPGWAIGVSMMATSISSVTFLAYPAAAYQLDWRQFYTNLPLPLVILVAIFLIIPRFREKNRTTAFEYLEDRYGPVLRTYCAFTFLLLQVVRVSTIIYLVSLPVSLLLDLDIYILMALIAVVVAFLSVAGGIEAVIWTDVIQAVVLLGGGILCLFFIVINLPGGLPQVFEVGRANSKFSAGSMDFNFSERTFWSCVLLGVFSWTNAYIADQNVVQRYLASSSNREASKATVISILTSIPTYVFFFFLGTALFVYYTVLNDPAVAGLDADRVLPHFIISNLPIGISGVIIAAVLSAAISSLSSNVNAIATVATVDIFKRYFCKRLNDEGMLKVARWISLVAIFVMVGGGVLVDIAPKETIFDLTLMLVSMLGGCMVGIFLVGFLSKSVDYHSALWATGLATIFNLYLVLGEFKLLPEALTLNVHVYWYGLMVNFLFVILAFAISTCKTRSFSE